MPENASNFLTHANNAQRSEEEKSRGSSSRRRSFDCRFRPLACSLCAKHSRIIIKLYTICILSLYMPTIGIMHTYIQYIQYTSFSASSDSHSSFPLCASARAFSVISLETLAQSLSQSQSQSTSTLPLPSQWRRYSTLGTEAFCA